MAMRYDGDSAPCRLARFSAACGLLSLIIGGLPLAAAAAPRVGPGAALQLPDSGFKVQLTGYVQGDLRAFPGWPEDTGDAALHSATSDVRRLRLGFEAEWHGLALDFSADPQDTGNHLKNAYADFRFSKALRLRAGHFKLPISRELLTSAARTDFVERSLLAQNLGPDRDWGVMAHGAPFRRAEYLIGVFAGDGSASDTSAKTTVAARVAYSPTKRLEIAASASQGDVESPVLSNSQLNTAKGFKGEGPSGFTYFHRPFVNGRRTRLNLDAALISGPAALKAEVLYGRAERLGQGSICTPLSGTNGGVQTLSCDDLPDFAGFGWSASGTWLVTGEKKKTSVAPEHPLPRGVGAVELGVRVEGLRLDSTAAAGGYESVANRARNLRPAADLVVTAGGTWWPTRWSRLVANLIVERLSDELRVPEAEKRSYVTLLFRLQVELP
jgi:phosphate-selective porin